MTPYPGKLIALEGIDGAGKTTQVSLLAAFLRNAKEIVVSSKEPTDGKWGRRYENPQRRADFPSTRKSRRSSKTDVSILNV